MAPPHLVRALFEAARRGDAAEVDRLLAAGADPNSIYTEVLKMRKLCLHSAS